MKRVHCDECGKEITGQSMARAGIQCRLEKAGMFGVGLKFIGLIPDVCNECILKAITKAVKND